MNKPQPEGKVNSRVKSTIVSLSKVIFLISMIELDHQRSAAKTLVNKMGLDTCVLFNIFNYCRFVSYSVCISPF